MFKRNKLSFQKQLIANISNELVPNVGDKATWVSPLIGSFALFKSEISVREDGNVVPIFELIAGQRIDLKTNQFPMTRYMYEPSGNIFGRLNTYAHTKDNRGELEASEESDGLRFQIDNHLYVPNQEDYDKLELYLKNGKMDKV